MRVLRGTEEEQKKMGTNTEMQALRLNGGRNFQCEGSQRCQEVSVLGDTWNPSGACFGCPCAELGQAALQPPLGSDPGKRFAGE